MATYTGALLEFYVPCVKFEGLKTNKDVSVGDGATVTLPSTTTIGGSAVVALGDITSSSTTATAFTVTNSGIFTGTDVVQFIANSATSGRVFSITANGLTSGAGLLITSSGTLVTTGNLLTLTANSATTAAGIFRINANGLTSGIGAVITSSATAITGAGRLLRVDHTGATGTTAILSEFASAANDETVIVKITGSDALALGIALDISLAAMTTGKGIDISNLDAITTGKALHIDATGVTQTDGILVHIDSASTALTATGRLLLVDHTGNAGVSNINSEFKSAAADETVIVKITASDVNALGTALQVSTATTTGNGITVTANSITDGFGISVTSSNTTLSSTGRLLNVNHSGNAGVSAVIAEVKSAAADETVVFQVLASAALAAGKVVNLSAAAVTTGTVLSAADANALTTGMIAQFKSNSSDATARTLVDIHNDHASAVGVIPLKITNDAPTSTNFKLMMTLGTMQVWVSDQTSPNTALTATEGSICFNGSATGQMYWNTDGATAWTAFA